MPTIAHIVDEGHDHFLLPGDMTVEQMRAENEGSNCHIQFNTLNPEPAEHSNDVITIPCKELTVMMDREFDELNVGLNRHAIVNIMDEEAREVTVRFKDGKLFVNEGRVGEVAIVIFEEGE